MHRLFCAIQKSGSAKKLQCRIDIEYKKTTKPVSRILFFHKMEEAIIYLGRHSHAASRCQPTNIRRAAVERPFIWHFSTQGLPLHIVTNAYRSLLHYFFTLTQLSARRLFSVALSVPLPCYKQETYPLGSALPFAVRTFLHCFQRR